MWHLSWAAPVLTTSPADSANSFNLSVSPISRKTGESSGGSSHTDFTDLVLGQEQGGQKFVSFCRHGCKARPALAGRVPGALLYRRSPADGQEPRRHNFGEILRPGRPERRKTVKPFKSAHCQRGLGEIGPPDWAPRAAGTSPVGASRQVRLLSPRRRLEQPEGLHTVGDYDPERLPTMIGGMIRTLSLIHI